jgi:MarR family 2-MHQ and catechol resistance regulon transcriptional repressor
MQEVSGVHVWLILMKAFRSIAAYVEPKLRESGLGDSDFRVLEVLLHKGPLPVNTIGPKVMLTPGSISTAVDRLHARGLVSRVDSEEDRRVRMVDLTAKGRKLISCVFSAHAAHVEALAAVLTPSERVQLVKALKKLGKRAAADAAPYEPKASSSC